MNLKKYKEKLKYIQKLREENNTLQEKLKKMEILESELTKMGFYKENNEWKNKRSQEIKKLEEIEVSVAELYICQNRNEMDRQNRISTEYIHSEIKKLISQKKREWKTF